jgi:hypothetical protein
VVERDLAKVEVASSTLVSRSKFERRKDEGERIKSMLYLYPDPFSFMIYALAA